MFFVLAACRPGASIDPQHDVWRAWLDSPGGELPFGLQLRHTESGVAAVLLNGTERIPVSRTELTDGGVTLHIEPYDSRVVATFGEDGRRLDGRWEKTGVGGEKTGLDFHAVAVFETDPDGTVRGTFLTTTGDYRYLAGSLDGDRLRLSCFDGAHAFLFDARLQEDGTLSGDFWSRDSWHERFTARKDPDAALPDAFELTHWVGGEAWGDELFPDLDGHERMLSDPAFAGRARILVIFGSWCPNCNDSTAFLVELDRKYRERGLAILGLAFEMTGDFERDAAQVRLYARHHGIEFPLLVAGVSDKEEASRVFPLLDRVRSYPTTIFINAEGRVRAVHQGYSGPATGEAHRELRERFESLVQELLADDVD